MAQQQNIALPAHIQNLMIFNYWLRMDEIDLELAQALLRNVQQRRQDRLPRRRRLWVRNWLLRRREQGQFHQLMQELQAQDIDSFRGYLRMYPPLYHELCDRLHDRLVKQDTNYRQAISLAEKIAVTLRFPATGDSYRDLAFAFRIAHNTISDFVPEVCRAIVDELGGEVMIPPHDANDWRRIAQRFQDRWNFPHVLGALDGKHIRIQCPAQSGSYFRNYKGFFSIILMALVDADYRFIWVDVGKNGSCSDAQVFNQCTLKDGLQGNTMNVPPPDPIPHDDRDMPYFIIADDAFAMKTWLMKPYAQRDLSFEQRIYNYRLSRARRVVENAFGILANKWGCLKTEIALDVPNTIQVVKACVCLHNLCRMRYRREHRGLPDHEDRRRHLVDGAWRQGINLLDLARGCQGRNRDLNEAKQQRNYLREYFMSPAGSVSWQADLV